MAGIAFQIFEFILLLSIVEIGVFPEDRQSKLGYLLKIFLNWVCDKFMRPIIKLPPDTPRSPPIGYSVGCILER